MKFIRQSIGKLVRFIQSLNIYQSIFRFLLNPFITYQVLSQAEDQVLPNPQATNWVAKFMGFKVGFVQLVFYPPKFKPYKDYWLFSLRVNPFFKRLKIGEKLSLKVIEQASSLGAKSLDLVVRKDNQAAIKLYQKLGFKPHLIPGLEEQLIEECAKTNKPRITMRKILS